MDQLAANGIALSPQRGSGGAGLLAATRHLAVTEGPERPRRTRSASQAPTARMLQPGTRAEHDERGYGDLSIAPSSRLNAAAVDRASLLDVAFDVERLP
jgi:hypothetical protein